MQERNISALTIAFVLLLISIVTVPNPVNAAPTDTLGIGFPKHINELPLGIAKSRLQSLPPKAQQKALEILQSFSFPVSDLEFIHFDKAGGVFYVDPVATEEQTTTSSSMVPTAEQISGTDIFKLHSRPGAPNIVFIDFDGHNITGTGWNSSTGVNTLYARAFDVDGNPTSFNSEEISRIHEIWHRIAEDYAPFDIDVTTEDPGVFNATTGRILITTDTDLNGKSMPAKGAGGVAYVNVWGSSYYPDYSPALVYYNNLGAGHPPYVSEAASHELGHNLSLSHDGTGSTSYYTGHGAGNVSWAPIMGVGYYKNVTQWSKGEYAGANNTQDDVLEIKNRLSLRPDDHGNSSNTSSALLIEIDGSVLVTTPETDNPLNPLSHNKGIIETRNDIDMFYFNAGAGPVNLLIEPAWAAFYRTDLRGANLDIEATLYDLSGNIITSSEPFDDTDAVITANVAEGTYYLAIAGVGNANTPYSNYGSLGEYFISGTITPSGQSLEPPTAPSQLNTDAASFSQINLSWLDNSFNETGFYVERSLDQNNWSRVANLPNNSNSYSDTNINSETTYFYQVIAYNSAGMTYSNISSTITPAQPTPPSAPINIAVADGANATAIVNWTDTSDNEAYFEIEKETWHPKRKRWQSNTIISSPAANSTSYTDSSGTGQFRYRVRSANTAGFSVWTAWAEVNVTDISSGDSGGGSGKCHPKRGC